MKPAAIPAMLSMIPSVLKGVTPRDIEQIKHIVRETFPAVKQITPQELEDRLATTENDLLIDTRSPAEYAVSHLPNAINLRTPSEIQRAILERNPTRAIVYCSVGFRSSWLASRLPKNLHAKIFNLEGSIFQWANEGRPVFQGEVQTDKVHPYGQRWSGLLNPGLASDSR